MPTLADLTSQVQPLCHIALTLKLTDDNNVAQPKLSFQYKAVQDFYMCQAQEAQEVEFPLNSLSPDASPTTTL
jgi:hypothetical protein